MFLEEFLKIIFFGSGAGFRRVFDFIVQPEINLLALKSDVCLPLAATLIPADAGHTACIIRSVMVADCPKACPVYTVRKHFARIDSAAAGLGVTRN